MTKILKLNAISPVADKHIPTSYEYSDSAENPDGIILRSFSMHDYPLNENLIAVARAGAGTNNIPIPKCTEQGIVVFNTPGANANAVKELVVCELFLGGRKIVDAIDWTKTLKGEGANVSKLVEKGKGKFVGVEVLGKTLGVIGLGAIGRMIANSAISLGMDVIGNDPYISIDGAWSLDQRVQHAPTREDVFKQSDFITLHVPLNDETKGMIDKNTISMMKDGVVIINNSRGELVNTADMIEALASGKVSRYITDFPADELIGVENAICVPHLGASTPEAEDNCAKMAAKQLVEYIENGNIVNSVNFPSITMPRTTDVRVCVLHKNVKEMLSKILAFVSSSGLNIENMQDLSKGENAYLILDVSALPSKNVIASIEELDGVLKVRVLKK